MALAVAGCVWTAGAASPLAQGRSAAMPAGVQTAKLPDGTPMLTDGKGMTLYVFLKDGPDTSNCNGQCAMNWPPLAADGAPPSDAWTVVTRMDGSKQWAYRKRPLYAWAKDAVPGDITGDGVANGAWKVAAVDAPPNMMRVHLSYISTSFHATPNKQGLLPVALAEAATAAQHAALAEKAAGNLDAMKLHAGHVLHVIDPSLEPMGPGLGFGVKPAAAGIADQVQLGAKTLTASIDVLEVGGRLLTCASNTTRRADEIAALAKRIRAATSADAAAADVARMNELAQELTHGADINKDGQVGWQTGEGGLLQAEAQLKMMLKGT
jgi:predicted lipoprotein with Yx(FWY)xxD motif